MSKAILTEDVKSNKSDKPPYGNKGESVEIISESETVFIVENTKGNRYPVASSKLQKSKK